ncbi:hypothetical protein DFP94_104307 [Fontibacillus phaseoli]|uniref:Transmembrane protein n=1 Tax=Fontibacillus phaseoli TaxID=1416533 RepID=A0A369BE75_9BACL|nr:hypothetical protein DFP94_104307 [Fontibacillus phaseoli]
MNEILIFVQKKRSVLLDFRIENLVLSPPFFGLLLLAHLIISGKVNPKSGKTRRKGMVILVGGLKLLFRNYYASSTNNRRVQPRSSSSMRFTASGSMAIMRLSSRVLMLP